MKRVNILLISSEFPPGPGGIGNHSYNLAKQLDAKGFNICVLTPRVHKPVDENFDKSHSFIIHRYSRNTYLSTISIIIFVIREYLKNNKYILVASGQIPLFITCVFLKLFIKKSLGIFHGHELSLGNKSIKYLLKQSINNFYQIIAVSSFSKDRALSNGTFENKIKVINNGFDMDRFNNSTVIQKRSDNLKLITLGSLSYRKGQHNVIKALPQLIQYYDDAHYDMVGEPYIMNDLKKIAQSVNVEHLVKFHGVLDDKELNKILLASDIFIMLSDNTDNGDVEGFGIAILEANYLGLPTIGSIGCGIEDAIRPGYNGELISNNNPQELIRALDRIMSDYERYSECAIKWAKKHSWNIISDYYITEINSIK